MRLTTSDILPLLTCFAPKKTSHYNPLAIAMDDTPTFHDLTVKDTARDRIIPVRIYLPEQKSPAPILIFSHGLGGSREGTAFLGRHWVMRGYAVAFLQHPGSDSIAWADLPIFHRLEVMRHSISWEKISLRAGDVTAAIDQLQRWASDPRHTFYRRLNLRAIGMAGRSLGAMTTQAVTGEFSGEPAFTPDPRIKAAAVISPAAMRWARRNPLTLAADIPWLVMSAKKDDSLESKIGLELRRQVYRNLPPGGKFELVLGESDHSIFSDREPAGERPSSVNQQKIVKAITTAFWDAKLRDDDDAQDWLMNNASRDLLKRADVWRWK